MSYSPEQIQRVANMLRYSGTDEFSEEAADMLNDFATLHQQAARVDEDAYRELVEAAQEMMSQDAVQRATHNTNPFMADAADKLNAALRKVGAR